MLHRKLLPLLILLAVLVPGVAHADIGANIVSRMWDSMISTTQNRMRDRTPDTVTVLQEAENIFLGRTEDITTMTAVREVYKAMRVAGLLLLGLCTIISLSQMAEAGLMGESSNLTDWIKRFCVAAFMTMGSIHFYGIWIRVFNAMLDGFRGYLNTHWTGPQDPTALLTNLIGFLNGANTLLILIFSVVMIIVLLVLWFLIGGIRVAELAIAVIIAPLVWPVYLIPALDDIPKTAFRSFLGLNATLLIIVGMLRLALHMEVGGGIGNTVWNFVPSIAMLIMAVFLPTMIKRIVGQGNTGSGLLMTAAYALAGIKGLSLMSKPGGNQGAAVSPPAQAAVPQSPAGPSAYPVAPLSSSGVAGTSASTSQAPPLEEVWVSAARQVYAGARATHPALETPYEPAPGQPITLDLAQSEPGSNKWDTVSFFTAYENGRRRVLDPEKKPQPKPDPETT